MTTVDLHHTPASGYNVRQLHLSDLGAALQRGLDDFWSMPSHLVFLGLLYPLAGLVIGVVTAGQNAFYLLYPLLSGFVLLGPFAAIGLYEVSRRRERGEVPTWKAALEVVHAPGLSALLGIGLLLAILFIAWLITAHAIYTRFFGDTPATSYSEFFSQVFASPAGISMIVVGNIIGLVFAIAALSISLFSFPLILDQHASLQVALQISVRAVWQNFFVCAAWGVIVASLLAAGMAAVLMGLAIVVPVLAHATWHLYRRAIEVRY